jgi:HK97 family phage major capsid protein
MFFRMPQQDRAGAVWLVSPEVEAVLPTLVISGTTVPAYMPANGLAASPFSTLLGRPVMVHPNASAIGSVGDISFVNLKKYMTLVKSPGIKSDVSMHVYFLNDVQTFKFTMRLGGKPWLDAVPTVGGVSYSPFVGLALRE